MQRPEPDETRPIPGSPAERGWGPLVLAGLVFLVSLAITWVDWSSARRDEDASLAAQFEYRARDLATSMVRRMAVYEQVLRGTRGFMRGRVDVSRGEFADYFQIQNLQEHFPGIEALGVASIIPRQQLAAHEAALRRQGFTDYRVTLEAGREVYTSITHIEPFAGRNLRAFGYDMYGEPVRRAAMDAARDSGAAALSGKVVLLQEGRNAQPGFLMYVPVYRSGMPAASVEQRRAAIVGWVYAPFRMADLMRGVGGIHAADLQVAVYDGARLGPDPAPAALLFRSQDATAWRRPLFRQTLPLTISGRRWTVDIASSPAFEARRDSRRLRVIAVTGAGLGFLLSLVVWLLASERRRALQLARAMTLELRQSYERNEAERTRMDAILRSSQKLEAVGKLTGGVVHDFNNILHIISANVQLMLRSGNNPEKRLRNILDAVERGTKLSAQLLAFARRQPLHPSVVDVGDLLARMDSLLQRAAGESVAIELVRRPAGGALWNTLVDPNQLENVILNLVINARDAMTGAGKVSITLANFDAGSAAALADPEIEPGEFVLIAVSDTGEGMPPEVMERAFEPFFTTKPEGKGTGLGLSMAHGFVKQSGGHIRIASVPGEGTTISIYLPRHRP
ncbi:MAG: diguanylate cyclase [Massilia sp.]|nr:diguanylate cyclase [Massilia sp.]